MAFINTKTKEVQVKIVFVGPGRGGKTTNLEYIFSRIRHRIIPQMQKLNPSFLTDIHQTIRNIREAETIYRSAVEVQRERLLIPDGKGVKIPLEALASLHPLRTWLFEILSPYGFNAPTVGDMIESFGREPGRVFLSPEFRLVRDRDHLLVQPLSDPVPADPVKIPSPVTPGDLPVRIDFQVVPATEVVLAPDKNMAFLDMDKLQFPLTLRKWKRGDSFFPLGMKRKKKLSDFFTDQKLSVIRKENTWLLCSGGEIAWVIGMRIDDRFKVTASTTRVLKISSGEDYPVG